MRYAVLSLFSTLASVLLYEPASASTIPVMDVEAGHLAVAVGAVPGRNNGRWTAFTYGSLDYAIAPQWQIGVTGGLLDFSLDSKFSWQALRVTYQFFSSPTTAVGAILSGGRHAFYIGRGPGVPMYPFFHGALVISTVFPTPMQFFRAYSSPGLTEEEFVQSPLRLRGTFGGMANYSTNVPPLFPTFDLEMGYRWNSHVELVFGGSTAPFPFALFPGLGVRMRL